jgi:phosphoheptose isomerase
VDEFLEKLAEDQRRMRKFLRTQGSRFKKIGNSLAGARDRGTRIFLVGEPPLDHVAQIIAVEYFQQLPVVPLSLEDGAKAPDVVESSELDPAASEGAGPPLVARHLSRHFHPGDVLIVIAHVGQHPAVKALLGFAKLKSVHAILIGGLEARAALRRAADTAISLPTKGVKTVCEASFVVARILARVARGHLRAKSGAGAVGKEDEERLLRIECAACKEPVFVEERMRGKKGKCPLCDASIKIPSQEAGTAAPASASRESSRRERPEESTRGESRRVAVAEASTGSGRDGGARRGKSSRRRPKRPLKQSVLNIPAASDPDKASEVAPLPEELEIDSEVVEAEAVEAEAADRRGDERGTSSRRAFEPGTPISGALLVEAAGETSASDNEPPPVGLSSRDVDEIVIAPEDLAFDQFANATDSADPFALPDAFVADLVMPQGRPSTAGAPPPSDVNPVVSGERPGSSADASHDESSRNSGRLVSARFSVQDCKLRFGIGGFPDDSGPEHPLQLLTPRGLSFILNSEDDMSSTVDKGDELWVRLSVPAFIEPVLVRAAVLRIGGNSGGRGTRVELEWKELDPAIIRKLARAAETLGVGK